MSRTLFKRVYDFGAMYYWFPLTQLHFRFKSHRDFISDIDWLGIQITT